MPFLSMLFFLEFSKGIWRQVLPTLFLFINFFLSLKLAGLSPMLLITFSNISILNDRELGENLY